MTLAVAAACSAEAQDTCLDDGGVWDQSNNTCVCSGSQLGRSNVEPSDDQLAWREWCADVSDLDSIENKAAVTPAPSGD